MDFVVRILSHGGVLFMRLIAPLPLPVVRGMGWLLGQLLYLLIWPRRKIVRVNLSLCFPEMPLNQRHQLERQVFVRFAQAWLDRSWLWHGSREQLAKRLKVTGDVKALREQPHLVLFSPHFVGLDAGGVAITKEKLRPLCSIYSSQRNAIVDEWILQGRLRFGGLRLFARMEGVREIAASVETGEALYLLPDMDFGTHGAEFVPFFGVNAATVTSLSRFARLCKAKVITLSNRMTSEGYEVNFSQPWSDFPNRDARADTERMNRELQALVLQAPDQYYWVHKRFKTRPPGEPSVY
ncbi:MAG: lipid A biosynthesis acyltransferase [Burkholderiales bacterium]|nr:MAG: lipid A biosynthesis acyltransferase [Burkholderiales bacterium]